MYNLTLRRVRVTTVAVELSGVQIASSLRRAMLPSVACLSLPDFLTLYKKLLISEKKKLLNIKCFESVGKTFRCAETLYVTI